MKFWQIKRREAIDEKVQPPSVTLAQWILVLLPAVGAIATYEVTSYAILALSVNLLAVLNLALLVIVARESLHTRTLGKSCLVAGTFLFYWVEAIALAWQKLPFDIAEGFPIHASQFDQELISRALVSVTLFQILLFVGYSIRPRISRVVNYFERRVDSLSFNRWIIGFLLALCAVLPLLIYYEFDFDKIVTALLASRSGGNFDTPEPGLAQHLALFGLFGASLFFVYALKTNTWRRLWWLVLGVMAALPFVSGGTRHLWLYISLPSLLMVLRGFKGKITGLRLVALTVTALVVIVVAQAQFTYRTVGWSEIGKTTPAEFATINNTGQFTALLFAQHLVPNDHPYFREFMEPYFLIHWIPRQVWPDKPIMESWAYYNESYVEGGAYNVTPSVIGQYHLNWGLPGVIFIGAWLGFLSFVGDRLLVSLDPDRQRAMFVVLGMFYAFIISSFRFYSPIYFSYFLFGLLAMFLLTRRERLFHLQLRFAPKLSDGVRAS